MSHFNFILNDNCAFPNNKFYKSQIMVSFPRKMMHFQKQTSELDQAKLPQINIINFLPRSKKK